MLAEGEEAEDLFMLDEELVQPQLEVDFFDPDHDGALQKVLSPCSAMLCVLALL